MEQSDGGNSATPEARRHNPLFSRTVLTIQTAVIVSCLPLPWTKIATSRSATANRAYRSNRACILQVVWPLTPPARWVPRHKCFQAVAYNWREEIAGATTPQ